MALDFLDDFQVTADGPWRIWGSKCWGRLGTGEDDHRSNGYQAHPRSRFMLLCLQVSRCCSKELRRVEWTGQDSVGWGGRDVRRRGTLAGLLRMPLGPFHLDGSTFCLLWLPCKGG